MEAGIPICALMAHAASLGGSISMKLLVGTAILCMLATAPVYARQNQDDKQQESSKAPKSNDNRAEKPASKSPEKPVDKPSRPPKEAPVRTESTPRPQQDQQHKQAEQQAKNRRQDQNPSHGHAVTADNAARGNQGGGHRIPEDRYRADFGRAHTFHVRHDGDRFQFGGYSFEYTEAWPTDWGNNDDFYIIEINGVDYLCDARFPDQRIVVVIAA
jgi:type IV secretory pathway VirB10-like protein